MVVVVMMMCVVLLLILLGLPLLLLAEREKDITDVVVNATSVSFIFNHARGVRRAAMGCRRLSRLLLRVAAGVNCASVLGDCHHFNAPPQSSSKVLIVSTVNEVPS